MPRKPRQESASGYYHFINRGVNRDRLFFGAGDYATYRALLKETALRFGIKFFHYCFLSNHTHILLHSPGVQQVSSFAHSLHRRYAFYLCKKGLALEQVFKKHFVSKPIENDAYLLECARYVERNPVRAGIVKDPQEYAHSSYPFYAKGAPDDLLEANPLYADLGCNDGERRAAYRAYVRSVRLTEMELF